MLDEINEQEEVSEITLGDILKVRDKLKKFSHKWSKKLAVKMFPNEDIETARERVYNIVQGTTRNDKARTAFVLAAKEVLEELKNEVSGVRGIIDEIIND